MQKQTHHRINHAKLKNEKPSLPKPLLQPEWNSCMQDHDQFKLSKADQIQKKVSLMSKHRGEAKECLSQRMHKLQQGIVDEETERIKATAQASKNLLQKPNNKKELYQKHQQLMQESHESFCKQNQSRITERKNSCAIILENGNKEKEIGRSFEIKFENNCVKKKVIKQNEIEVNQEESENDSSEEIQIQNEPENKAYRAPIKTIQPTKQMQIEVIQDQLTIKNLKESQQQQEESDISIQQSQTTEIKAITKQNLISKQQINQTPIQLSIEKTQTDFPQFSYLDGLEETLKCFQNKFNQQSNINQPKKQIHENIDLNQLSEIKQNPSLNAIEIKHDELPSTNKKQEPLDQNEVSHIKWNEFSTLSQYYQVSFSLSNEDEEEQIHGLKENINCLNMQNFVQQMNCQLNIAEKDQNLSNNVVQNVVVQKKQNLGQIMQKNEELKKMPQKTKQIQENDENSLLEAVKFQLNQTKNGLEQLNAKTKAIIANPIVPNNSTAKYNFNKLNSLSIKAFIK